MHRNLCGLHLFLCNNSFFLMAQPPSSNDDIIEPLRQVHLKPQGSRKNNFTFLHLSFGPSLADTSLAKSAKQLAIPVVLLSRISQTCTKSERQFCEVIFARTLKDLSFDYYGFVNPILYPLKHCCRNKSPFSKVIIVKNF